MKKLLPLLLGFILGLGAMYLYCADTLTVSDEEPPKVIKPKGVITPAQARVLNDNWTKKGQVFLDSVETRPDNRSSWWSIDDINSYITYADKQTDSLGFDLTGLRMYYGRYSNNAPNGNADYATIFIVPTGKKKNTTSEGSFVPIKINYQGGGNDDDVDGADPLNRGGNGHPPGTGYGG
ncbi:hypothetical protein Q2T40_12175 [Winogradskyella maritima]|uniref:Lipoprotein n=1 Tax=Winogradskyella maritima TaxID=1517766 RepID=A0ABV8AIE5_9FLAO|nr:hypothetical protein [Winogradskyella maritima]